MSGIQSFQDPLAGYDYPEEDDEITLGLLMGMAVMALGVMAFVAAIPAAMGRIVLGGKFIIHWTFWFSGMLGFIGWLIFGPQQPTAPPKE